jgi:DNA polymerase-1
VKCIFDVETNSLINPTKIWVVVFKNIENGELHVFQEPTTNSEVHRRLVQFCSQITYLVGHNSLEFDCPVLDKLLGIRFVQLAPGKTNLDTLIVSRLVNYSRSELPATTATQATPHNNLEASGGTAQGLSPGDTKPLVGHSLESYGLEFGYPKIKFSDFTKYSEEMERYCVRDVEITLKVWLKYLSIITDHKWLASLVLEHDFQTVVNALHDNGFSFNTSRAEEILTKVTQEIQTLDSKILEAFPPREVKVREFTPRATKFGTISKTSVPRSHHPHIHEYEIGCTYPVYQWKSFNPASHRQLIEVLNLAGWKPTDRTQSHIDTERDYNRNRDAAVEEKLNKLKITGWKINENNLNTLPNNAPVGARLLAKRILLESRRRTLTEWLNLVDDDGRIHGRFVGIGAWTHRMAHQRPNTANIPNDTDISGKTKLLGKELRALWQAPPGRLLVGVDAEGIQLRIFAHLIDDKEFTKALVEGRKDDKTDPHSLNQKILGSVCKSRAAAKRFIYALLLGAGNLKLAQILECSEAECKEALERLLQRYTGWQQLKDVHIPKDARRGFFIGLDGRKVQIPGDTTSERRHLAISGYLQNGESIVMKKATLKWIKELEHASDTEIQTAIKNQESEIRIVNLVHDEWQTETPNDKELAIRVAECQSRALREVGEELGLKCPLSGSFFSDETHNYTIGKNWSVTH